MRYGVVDRVVSCSIGDDDREKESSETGDVRRAEMLARTLLTGFRDGEEEEEEEVAKLDRLPELLAIDSLDTWRERNVGRVERGLGVIRLCAASCMGVCSCSTMVERLSEDARKHELRQVGLSVGEQMGQTLSWL